MKTLSAIFSIAAITLCCSTAALAAQNTPAPAAAAAQEGCEELIITARRPTVLPVLSIADRNALSASIKLETSKEIRQSIEQFIKVNQVKTAMHSAKAEALQASL